MQQFLFYNEFIIQLYMYRAQLCSSSAVSQSVHRTVACSVMMPDAVWYNFDLLMMSTIVPKTCRGV